MCLCVELMQNHNNSLIYVNGLQITAGFCYSEGQFKCKTDKEEAG